MVTDIYKGDYSTSSIQSYLEQKTEYNVAIENYRKQKEYFLDIYAKALHDSIDAVEEKIVNDLFGVVESSPVQQQEVITEQLYNNFGTMIEKAFNQNNVKITAINQMRNGTKKKIKAQENLRKAMEQLISDEDIHNYIIRELASLNIQSYDYSQLFNSMKKYFIRSIEKRGLIDTNPYINSAKGYIREALVHQVCYEFFKNIDDFQVSAYGATPDEVTGKETPIDELIEYVSKNFNKAIETGISIEKFGIQIKSFTLAAKKGNYGLGSRAFLLAAANAKINMDNLDFKYSWIESTRFLGMVHNIMQIIGEHNTFYITGDSFMWTMDLITEFRQKQYWLAFHFNKDHKAQNNVLWTKIRKNF